MGRGRGRRGSSWAGVTARPCPRRPRLWAFPCFWAISAPLGRLVWPSLIWVIGGVTRARLSWSASTGKPRRGRGPLPRLSAPRVGGVPFGLVAVGPAFEGGGFSPRAHRGRSARRPRLLPFCLHRCRVCWPLPPPPCPPPLRSLRSLSGGGCSRPSVDFICGPPPLVGSARGRGRGSALWSAWAPRPMGAPRRPRSPSLPSLPPRFAGGVGRFDVSGRPSCPAHVRPASALRPQAIGFLHLAGGCASVSR